VPGQAKHSVLHAVRWFGLPSETFVRDAIAQTGARGWEPWVCTLALKGEHEFPTERILLPKRPSPLADRLRKRLSPPGRRASLSSSLDFLRMTERSQPDLVHAHFGWAGLDVRRGVTRLGLPWIVSLHGTDVTVEAQRHPERYRAMLEAADRVTVGSNFLRARLESLGLRRRLDVIPPGVDLDRFPFQAPRRLPGDLRLLFVGRLTDGKGAHTLLRALASVRGEEPTASLSLIGDGPLRASLEATACDLGLEGSIGFLGYREPDEVSAALRSADILVMPSESLPNGQAEGSGVVPKEAFASGAQVVATHVGGIGETFPPELRHELVPERQPAMLAHQILSIWRHRRDWAVRAELGRRWVESRFDWAVVGKQLAGIYESMLEQRRPSR
jgi:glycosyltransferase involved in cell wall biosynthesis